MLGHGRVGANEELIEANTKFGPWVRVLVVAMFPVVVTPFGLNFDGRIFA